jgi:hypothetical protein
MIVSMKEFKTNLSKLISQIEKTFFMRWIPKIFKFVDLRTRAQFCPFYLYLKLFFCKQTIFFFKIKQQMETFL